jgi:hypothetical protein
VSAQRGQRLSEAILVEASVVARLLRIRLLVIDASLIIAPAQVEGRTRAATYAADEPLAPVTPRTRARAIGAGLAAAERCLSEGAASLARSRELSGRSVPRSPSVNISGVLHKRVVAQG